MNNRTKSWNNCATGHVDEIYLYTPDNLDYFYRLLKSKVDSLFYAFENGNILSINGEKSYRSALRKHLLSRMNRNVRNGYTCAIGTFNEAQETVITELNINNLMSFLRQYFYDNVYEKYGTSLHTSLVHNLIDDWNQIPDKENDLTLVNPHDIKVSKTHDVTLQELTDNSGTLHYFINGIPATAYHFIERILINGMLAGEKTIGTAEYFENGVLTALAKAIDNGESYIVIPAKSSKNNLESQILMEVQRLTEEINKINIKTKNN
jgi:hypothetical protein